MAPPTYSHVTLAVAPQAAELQAQLDAALEQLQAAQRAQRDSAAGDADAQALLRQQLDAAAAELAQAREQLSEALEAAEQLRSERAAALERAAAAQQALEAARAELEGGARRREGEAEALRAEAEALRARVEELEGQVMDQTTELEMKDEALQVRCVVGVRDSRRVWEQGVGGTGQLFAARQAAELRKTAWAARALRAREHKACDVCVLWRAGGAQGAGRAEGGRAAAVLHAAAAGGGRAAGVVRTAAAFLCARRAGGRQGGAAARAA